jgi:DNA-binding FrmR family transcriptional regulator
MTMRMPPDRSAAVRHAQRASGQAAALGGMISAARPFPDVAQQLLAARGSLDSLLVRLVEIEVEDCVPTRVAWQEVADLLRTALGRTAPIDRSRRPSGHRAIPPSTPDHKERTIP